MPTQVTQTPAGPTDEFARQLVVEHAPALRRYVGRLLPGDPHRAEDIVQETVLRAWMHSDRLAGEESVRGWLFRVARNLTVDWHRRRAARPPEVSPDRPDGADVFASDQLDNVLRARMLTDALRTLSTRQREVLVHLYYFGLTQSEVAQKLGMAQGTVKSHAHYGAAVLRRELAARGVQRSGPI